MTNSQLHARLQQVAICITLAVQAPHTSVPHLLQILFDLFRLQLTFCLHQRKSDFANGDRLMPCSVSKPFFFSWCWQATLQWCCLRQRTWRQETRRIFHWTNFLDQLDNEVSSRDIDSICLSVQNVWVDGSRIQYIVENL